MAKQQSEFRIVGAVSTPRGVFRAGDEEAAMQALSGEEVSSLRERGLLADADDEAPASAPVSAGGSVRGRALEPDAPELGGDAPIADATVRTMGSSPMGVPADGIAGEPTGEGEPEPTRSTRTASKPAKKSTRSGARGR